MKDAKRSVFAYWGVELGRYQCTPCSLTDKHQTIVYIRSGDIFTTTPEKSYGQPPLDFFVKAIKQTGARSITIASQDWGNPVLKALQSSNLTSSGEYSIDFQVGGDNYEAILKMIFCAQTLITGVTSMLTMSSYSPNLEEFYLGRVNYHGKLSNWQIPHAVGGRHLLPVLANPKVHGYIAGDYSPYKSWLNTPEQLDEMINYRNGKLVRLDLLVDDDSLRKRF